MKKQRNSEVFLWRPVATVRKFDDTGQLLEIITVAGNALTDSGITRILSLMTGNGLAGFTPESTRLGVGDNSEPANPSDTNLGDNEFYRTLDLGFPDVVDNTIVLRATFDVDDANFVWSCWGLDVNDDESPGSSSSEPADLFNRKVYAFGEKDGGVWDLTVQIPIGG